MRVAIDITAEMLSLPGVGRYTRELCAAMDRRRDVDVVRVGAHRPRTYSTLRNVERTARALMKYPLDLGRQARRNDADLVHLTAPITPVRSSVEAVVTVHDMLPWRYPKDYQPIARRREQFFTSRIVRAAHRVIVASQSIRSDLIDFIGLDESKVHVIPHGVDQRFGPHRSDPGHLAHRFGIPPGPFLLGVLSAERRKNLSVILDAFSLVRRRFEDINLVLAGDWEGLSPEMAERLHRMGPHIIRPGFADDEELAHLYSATACFVFPSLYEGFGLPPLEAMACGAPVVASHGGAVREVVGDAGIAVDPLDPVAVADGIEKVLQSPGLAAELRDAGMRRAASFTWDETARRTADVYRSALSNS